MLQPLNFLAHVFSLSQWDKQRVHDAKSYLLVYQVYISPHDPYTYLNEIV
jgi:hypothetical protein